MRYSRSNEGLLVWHNTEAEARAAAQAALDDIRFLQDSDHDDGCDLPEPDVQEWEDYGLVAWADVPPVALGGER